MQDTLVTEDATGGGAGWGLWALVVHEVWVFMQHANVLLNPYLQVPPPLSLSPIHPPCPPLLPALAAAALRCERGEQKTKAAGWRDVGVQRLDRDYGIALLRKRMYSVIAAVLAAYWARSRPPCATRSKLG